MSATREALCEKIRVYEEALVLAERDGSKSLDLLRSELSTLRLQLDAVNNALTEGKQILKG